MAIEQFARYREGFRKRWLDMLAARSRIVSPMIAGPANFPVRQMEKRRRSLDNRMRELTDYAERIRGKVIAAIHDAAPADKKRRDEVETYKRRIMQSAATVAAIDKGEERGYDRSLFVASVAGKIERLANRDLTAAQELLTWLRDEVQPHMPKPLFTARNKVWSILDRVPPEPAEAKPSEDIEGEAATLTINHERGGVELTFPGKPDEGIRSRLKAAGFRWSGRQGLWYARQNERTLAVAQEIAGIPAEAEGGDRAPREEGTVSKLTAEDEQLIDAIVARAASHKHMAEPIIEGYTVEQLRDDLVTVHRGDCPLDLHCLLGFDDYNFWSDIDGIASYLNRETGRITDSFLPRSSVRRRY